MINYLPILKKIALVLIGIIAINFLAQYTGFRIDFTEDKRYTLSENAKEIVVEFKKPIIIDVLLDGNLPPEFARLKVETKQLLEEFSAENYHIKYNFVNPFEDHENQNEVIKNLQDYGLTPVSISVKDGAKSSQEVIFPWAIVNSGKKSVRVSLLKNKLGASTEERVNNSIQHLEYAFANAFQKINVSKKKKIAILKGNGELDDIYIADYITSLKEYYNIGAITLDSVASNPEKLLRQLAAFDLAIIAKPTEEFSNEEKYILDQYTLQGGKSIWLIDRVNIELNNLFNEQGSTMALPRNLNLSDFFFKYGVRINPNLVSDMYHTQIVLASGNENDSQYQPLPWLYSPMVFSKNNHPLNTNIEAVRFQFSNSIDILKNDTKKTVLLQSSPLSKVEKAPVTISLNTINQPPNKNTFTDGNKAMAVLIEGNFESVYKNRIKPLQLSASLDDGTANQMIVIADGDLIKNQIKNGRPLELGYDKWTNNFYGNKEFLVNCANFLLDDTGLINIRSKKVSIPFLDSEKIKTEKTKWQFINIGLPLLLFFIFGILFYSIRKKKNA